MRVCGSRRVWSPGVLEHFQGLLEIAIPAAVLVRPLRRFCRLDPGGRDRTRGGRRPRPLGRVRPGSRARVLARPGRGDRTRPRRRGRPAGGRTPPCSCSRAAVAVGLSDRGRAGRPRDAAEHKPALDGGRLPLPPGRSRRSNLPRAALVVPLRTGDGTIGSLSAVTRAKSAGLPARSRRRARSARAPGGPSASERAALRRGVAARELDSLTGSPISASSTSCSGARSRARAATAAASP